MAHPENTTMLPASLQALKDMARATIEAAREVARQEEEARAAMNRDALRECIENTVSGDLLAAVGEIDMSDIHANNTRYQLEVNFPGHRPILAVFVRNQNVPHLAWVRQEFSERGSKWRVERRGCHDFADLGAALLFAEYTPEEVKWSKKQDEQLPF